MTSLKTIQTRDCYYPVYYCAARVDTLVEYGFEAGFYYYDDEMETSNLDDPSPYFGPYPTLDAVCKAQHSYYKIMMLL